MQDDQILGWYNAHKSSYGLSITYCTTEKAIGPLFTDQVTIYILWLYRYKSKLKHQEKLAAQFEQDHSAALVSLIHIRMSQCSLFRCDDVAVLITKRVFRST